VGLQSTAKDRLHRLNSRTAGIAPHQNYMRCDVTHLIHYLLPKMGRRLAPEVVYRIRVRIKAGEGVLAIAKAIEVSRPTVYKIIEP
jgi:DNA invertase Pin-like site-specific DNA recombinase